MFAEKNIPKGTKIIEYLGEIISKEEEARREKQNEKTNATYIFNYNSRFSIDGAIGGNESRLINHSCDPNCDATRSKNHVFYVSNRAILKDEELTVDYSFDADDPPEICHCGSHKCRGFINEVRHP